MSVVPYKRRLMVTKSIRIPEDLLKRIEAQLWNEDAQQVPFGKNVEFYTRAVSRELDRLEGKSVEAALNELSHAYAELASCIRVTGNDLKAIEQTIAVLKDVKQSREEKHATIE